MRRRTRPEAAEIAYRSVITTTTCASALLVDRYTWPTPLSKYADS